MMCTSPVLWVSKVSSSQPIDWFYPRVIDGCAKVFRFFSTDTEEKYENSLETQPQDWHYVTQKVEYHYNAHGFRAPELSTIDWTKSIVIFGCSQTEGIGLDESETISAQLQKITGIPVINMGVGASAMYLSYVNNLVLRKNYPTPLGVINYWTSNKRIFFNGKYRTVCASPVRNRNFYAAYYLNMAQNLGFSMGDIDHDENFKAKVFSDSTKVLWENTRYAEATWIDDTAGALGCKKIDRVDYARDLGHQGPQTARKAAEYFAEQLNFI